MYMQEQGFRFTVRCNLGVNIRFRFSKRIKVGIRIRFIHSVFHSQI